METTETVSKDNYVNKIDKYLVKDTSTKASTASSFFVPFLLYESDDGCINVRISM